MLVIANYPPCNIYNMDETGLYYRCLPNRSHIFTDETRNWVRGSKSMKDKNRLTVYFCTSATRVKVRLSVIGTSQRLRCFRRNAVLSSATYFSQKNAWSDDVVCRLWFGTVFLEHVRAVTTSPVLLLMDNHSSHNRLIDPSGQVRVESLPPNVTARKQSMDAGVIKTFKTLYRSDLLSHTCSVAFGKPLPDDFPKGGLSAGRKADVGDALHLAVQAWDRVHTSTIVGCWMKTGLLPDSVENTLTRAHGKTEVVSLLHRGTP